MCGVCSVCMWYVVWCLCVCGVCLCDRVCSVYDVCVWYVWCRGVVCGVVCVYVCVIVCVACVMCVHDVCGLCIICVMCVECVVCVWGGVQRAEMLFWILESSHAPLESQLGAGSLLGMGKERGVCVIVYVVCIIHVWYVWCV